jgi:hypothetical protein
MCRVFFLGHNSSGSYMQDKLREGNDQADAKNNYTLQLFLQVVWLLLICKLILQSKNGYYLSQFTSSIVENNENMFLFFIDVEKKSTGQYFLETCNMHP